PDSTYVLWLRNGQIPDLGWLKWLYGFPQPDDAFVVSLALQRLRREQSRESLVRAAGLNDTAIWHWEQDDRTRDVIAAILAGGKGRDEVGWDQLNAATQRRMNNVVKAASLDACCERAGLSVAQYRKEVAEADRCSVKAELLAYLTNEGRYAPPGKKGMPQDNGMRVKNRQSGLVVPNFFIPTPAMWMFRGRAQQEATKQNIWAITNLPSFDVWFRDWTAPKAHRGKRYLVPLISPDADAGTQNGSPD